MLHLRKMLQKKRNGFTLIELIVVLAILAIIALLAIPRFTGTLNKSKQQTHNANVRTIESSVALYEAEEGGMPANIAALVDGGYLKEIPTNPLTEAKDYNAINGVVTPGTVTVDGTIEVAAP